MFSKLSAKSYDSDLSESKSSDSELSEYESNDDDLKNVVHFSKSVKKKKNVKKQVQDPEVILNYFDKKIKSNDYSIDDAKNFLKFTSKLLNKYRNNKKQCDKDRSKLIGEELKLRFRDSKYNSKIEYSKNNTLIPNVDEYNALLNTVKEIVNNNWNNNNLDNRLSYNTEPIIENNGNSKTSKRFPEFFNDGNYKMNVRRNTATINFKNKNFEILLLNDKKLKSDESYLQNSGTSELKRFLNSLATDFNVVNLSGDYKLRISFIAIWLNIYETVFKEIYRLTKNELNENNLNIMFKGGVTMRAIILTAYIDFNLIDETNIFDDIKKIIKISDFDFEIISSTNDWKIINKLNIINYFVMNQVLEYFEMNKEYFFTFFKYNKNVKMRLGRILFDNIEKEIKLKKNEYDNRNDIFKYSDYYALIEPLFIELESNDNILENIFSHPIDYIANTYCNNNINNLNKIFTLPRKLQSDNFRKNFGIIINGRKASPMKQIDIDNIDISDGSKSYLTSVISERQMKDLYDIKFNDFRSKINNTNKRINNFYGTLNTNVYVKTKLRIIDFQLNRIKYNYTLYYRINVNGKYKYHREFFGGEVFDLSHAGVRDSVKKDKTKYSYANNQYIEKFNILGFKFPTNQIQINYLGYNIYGHYTDLEDIIFMQTDYRPWLDSKYEKRINRILHLVFIYLFQKKNYKELKFFNRLMISKRLISMIEEDKYNFMKNNLTIINQIIFNFKTVYDKLVIYKKNNKSKKDSDQYKKYINDFNEYKSKLIKILLSIIKIYNQRFYEPELLTYSNKIPINFRIFGIQNYSIY
jgi:hypothetical protein